jgi:hypothetical protein
MDSQIHSAERRHPEALRASTRAQLDPARGIYAASAHDRRDALDCSDATVSSTLKRPEGRAPERGIYAASAHDGRDALDCSDAAMSSTLKRPEGRAPERGIYAASGHEGRNALDCSDATMSSTLKRPEGRAPARGIYAASAHACKRAPDTRMPHRHSYRSGLKAARRHDGECGGRLTAGAPPRRGRARSGSCRGSSPRRSHHVAGPRRQTESPWSRPAG